MLLHFVSSYNPLNLFVRSVRLFFLILIMCMLSGHASSAQSEENIYLVKDINPFSMGPLHYGSNINSPIVMDNILYFTAFNGLDTGLWRSDGTPAGTYMVLGSDAENSFSGGSHLTVINDIFLFAGYSTTGGELWRSDGTAAGTVLVKDINPGAADSMIHCPTRHCQYTSFATLGGQLIFAAYTDELGFELWRSDGTTDGTTLVKDLNPGSTGGYPTDFVIIDDILFFVADDGVHGRELWRSDGTAAGTLMVKDIYVGTTGARANELIQFQHNLYFAAETADIGFELWTSDGTESGTILLADINSGSESSNPRFFTACHNRLFFNVSLPEGAGNGEYLWTTDGTADGTQPFMQEPLDGIVTMQPLECIQNSLYLLATNGQSIHELWTSDGTATGTVALDGNPESYAFLDFAPLSKWLFFVHSDDTHGYEPWLSDGTPGGTSMMQDIADGIVSSNSRIIAQSSTLVYLIADNGTTGEELWAMPLPQQRVYLPSVMTK